MTRILRMPSEYAADVFFLMDPERACSCGRTPGAVLAVTALEQLSNSEEQRRALLRERYLTARRVMRSPGPCDHGLVARCRARHARRHASKQSNGE